MHVSVMCVGTIPESSEYDVVIGGANKKVGSIHFPSASRIRSV